MKLPGTSDQAKSGPNVALMLGHVQSAVEQKAVPLTRQGAVAVKRQGRF